MHIAYGCMLAANRLSFARQREGARGMQRNLSRTMSSLAAPATTFNPVALNEVGTASSAALNQPHARVEAQVDAFAGEAGKSRRQLLSSILGRAHHIYNPTARAHIYYCLLSEQQAIHSIHALRDRAFEMFVYYSTQLSGTVSEQEVSDLLKAETGEGASQAEKHEERPPSAAINFRLPVNLAKQLREQAATEEKSVSKICRHLLAEGRDYIVENRRSIEPKKFGALISSYVRSTDRATTQLFTCRVGYELHTDVLALANTFDISVLALCSFLAHRHISGAEVGVTAR